MADLYTVASLDSAVYTNTANWIGGSAPTANDSVFFQYDASLALAGSDQSATELDDINVLPTCSGNAGSAAAYLQLDQGTANKTIFAGSGTWYLDLGGAGSSLVRVDRTRSAAGGQSALYFKNDTAAIALFEINSGSVRLVNANITTLVVRSGATIIIDSASTVATINNEGGTVIDYGAAVTTWNQRSGTTTRSGSDAAALNIYGGLFNNDGTGTLTAVQYGGILDSARDTQAKSVTLTLNAGTSLIGPNVTLTDTLNSVTTLSA